MSRDQRQIEMTAQEKQDLAAAITRAACGIRICWDVLNQIGTRIGRDWEPKDTSVAEIAERNASDIENPTASEPLDAESVAEFFSDSDDWQAC